MDQVEESPPPPAPWKPIQQASDGFLSSLSCIHSISLPTFHPTTPEIDVHCQQLLDYILKLDIIPFWSTLVFSPTLSPYILSYLQTDGMSDQAGTVFRLLCRIYNAVDEEGFGATFGSADAIGRWKESSLAFFSLPVLMVCNILISRTSSVCMEKLILDLFPLYIIPR